jgi:hypothetical protein
MKRRRFLAVHLGLLTAVIPSLVAARDLQETLRREAIDLFRHAVERPRAGAGRCVVRDAWLDYPIPGDIARRYLGRAIHADLVPPQHAVRPAAVIDPTGRMRDLFCDDAQAKQRQDELLADFRKGLPSPGAGATAPTPRLAVSHTEYSFPVFNLGYRRAIVMVARTSFSWTMSAAGEVKTGGIESGGQAQVYVRRGLSWRLLAREFVFSAH